MDEILPAALQMGVPYNLFWHLNPRKLEPFRKAYKDKLSQEDYNAWRQGAYIKLAVGSILFSKKCKYPENPFSLVDESGEQKSLSEEEKFILWIDEYNRRFEENNQPKS